MPEKQVVEALLEKWKAGERLTEREQTILAYSPLGWAAGCHCGGRG